ncbi:MAG: rane protein [Frankiales bacterium]|nr:rane protein [Frankiales bacterium]
MRRFSFGPTLAVKGRKFKGLRGYAGKPFHPPLTDVPIVAYLFAAVFDVLSVILHDGHPDVGLQLYRGATWLFLGGAAVSLLAALTGWADWHRSSEPGTQARRTVNAHAIIMIAVTVLTLADLAVRLTSYDNDSYAPVWLAVLSAVIAVGVTIGATYGGTLVFDYGFNVETAGDSPVWHKSEQDLYPGKKPAAGPAKADG